MESAACEDQRSLAYVYSGTVGQAMLENGADGGGMGVPQPWSRRVYAAAAVTTAAAAAAAAAVNKWCRSGSGCICSAALDLGDALKDGLPVQVARDPEIVHIIG